MAPPRSYHAMLDCAQMEARVIKNDDTLEHLTEERCFILESWNDPTDADVSIARARVGPGVTTALHTLEVDERYLIASGKARVKIEGLEPADVASGDVVVIPAGRSQRVTNTGAEDLVFYCICTPRFERRHYREVE